MRKFYVTCGFLIAILVAALIEYYCSSWPKIYFTMAFVSLFFLYWGIEFVLDYVQATKEYEERYQLYVAEKINKSGIDAEQIRKNRKKYYAAFKRSIFAERFWQVAKFLLCFGATIAIIVAMIV